MGPKLSFYERELDKLLRRSMARKNSLRNSSNHNTTDAMAIATPQWARSSGTVPKALCRKGSSTTAICRTAASATDAHSQRLLNRPRNALVVSERELNALNSCANTRVVKPAVRATSSESDPSIEAARQEHVDRQQRGGAHHQADGHDAAATSRGR